MPAVIERLREALNSHNPGAMLECFDPDYRSEQPAHPNPGFGGKEQVPQELVGLFESFPDFEAELLRHSAEGDVVWGEWHWSATRLNMAGVTGMRIKEDRISLARLFMEPVEEAGQDIDEAMRTITGSYEPRSSNRLRRSTCMKSSEPRAC